MADMQPVNIPQPPTKANVDDMHKHLTALNSWLQQNFNNGVQQTFLSQNQVNNISGNENIGKIHFNNDTGLFQGAVMIGGNLVIKTFMMV